MKVLENTVGDVLGYVCQKAVTDPAPFAPWPSEMRQDDRRELSRNHVHVLLIIDRNVAANRQENFMEIPVYIMLGLTSVVGLAFIVERALALRWRKVVPPEITASLAACETRDE